VVNIEAYTAVVNRETYKLGILQQVGKCRIEKQENKEYVI
jgi:hypothetical protein